MVIGGLKPDTTYSITVAAYTTKGDGARSKPKLVVTKGAGQWNVWSLVDGCDTAQKVGVFLRLHLWFVSRRRCELFWNLHVSDRLWGLQYPCWVVCLSFSNKIPEANVCTVQSLLFFWTLSLVTTTRHTSLTRPLEPVWKLAALAWTWGWLAGSMKAFFQKIAGSKPI